MREADWKIIEIELPVRMSSGITAQKGFKSNEVLKHPFHPSGRMSVRSKGSSEESENKAKAFKNFCRIFIEMIFTQVIVLLHDDILFTLSSRLVLDAL